jgi:hypothetical protein
MTNYPCMVLCDITTCYSIESAWVRRLELNDGQIGLKLCFQFQLAPLHRGHLDELGPASMFDAPSAVAVMPDTGGGVAFVADTGNHAIRRVARDMPTQLRVSVTAVGSNIYPGGGDESGRAWRIILATSSSIFQKPFP